MMRDCIEINIVIVEESYQWADFNILDGNSRQMNVIVLVRGQRVLVVFEQVNDFLVKLIESWVLNSDLSQFENRRRVIIDILYFGSIAKKLTRGGLKAAIVSWVNTSAGSLDDFSKNVQTLRLINREEDALGSDNMSSINSFDQSLFNFLDSLDKVVVIGSEMPIVMTSR